jgi:methyltransferase (TIGR00027 family)
MTPGMIRDTFDTARLTAYYRALESERPNAHFHDLHARLLAGEYGEQMAQSLSLGEGDQQSIVIRTCVYDEFIQRLIEQEGADTVINLAAGLDTRPYRLTLPASLRWFEVDLSPVLAYKEELLAGAQPTCILERVVLDVTNDEARKAFLTQISKDAKQVVVLTEGLLGYLTSARVAALATDLYEQPAIHWWITEFAGEQAHKRLETAWNEQVAEQAQLCFAPPSGSAFFQLYGWCVAEYRPPLKEALRLQLPLRRRWLMRLLMHIIPPQPDTTYSNGFLLLKRA